MSEKTIKLIKKKIQKSWRKLILYRLNKKKKKKKNGLEKLNLKGKTESSAACRVECPLLFAFISLAYILGANERFKE